MRGGRAMTRAILPGERGVPPPTLRLLADLIDCKKHACYELRGLRPIEARDDRNVSAGKTKDYSFEVEPSTATVNLRHVGRGFGELG